MLSKGKLFCNTHSAGGVQVESITKTSAKLKWTDGAPNGQPIYVYIISARTTYNDTWLNITRGL